MSDTAGLLPVIFLMGPTASGKTDLAAALLERFPLDIVSVDSALVYRGMDVGTAKPDAAQLQRAPHRLIDIRDPWQAYSAAAFCSDARREIEAIHAAGRVPLLVGGTMLYFKALREGLADMPGADEALRGRIAAQAEALGWPAMHARLAAVDPEAAARLRPTDSQRIGRALEVYEASGRPISSWWLRHRGGSCPWPLLQLGLVPADRARLHGRIEARLQAMFDAGFVAEVQGLYTDGRLTADMPSMRAVGYRQVWSYLAGDIDAETMRAQALYASRQLAKRQLTWLRRWPDMVGFDPFSSSLLDEVSKCILAFLHAADKD